MHDLMVAKEIFELILRYAHRNKFKKVNKVEIEIGAIKHEDHIEDISPKNLAKNIKALAKDSIAEKAEIEVSEISDQGYRLVSIEGDK